MFSLWSRVAARLLDAGDARRVEPAQQDGGLHLRRRDRQRGSRAAARPPRLRSASGRRPPARAVNRAPHAASGSVTRRIGRRRRLASPVMHREERVAGQDAAPAAARRCRNCPCRARPAGSPRPPTPRPATRQRRPRLAHHLGAQRAHRGGGAQHVLAFQQAGDARLAHREGAEHQRAMADGLVAGHA